MLERIEAVKATGYADEVIIEDYIDQKIDDIQKYDVDIFVISSDWEGKFDYLKEFCKVVYLPRTKGISSTMLRAESTINLKIEIIGCWRMAKRFTVESAVVSSVDVVTAFDIVKSITYEYSKLYKRIDICTSCKELFSKVDAVYISTSHLIHYQLIKDAIVYNKHVLCETPMVLNSIQAKELFYIS